MGSNWWVWNTDNNLDLKLASKGCWGGHSCRIEPLTCGIWHELQWVSEMSWIIGYPAGTGEKAMAPHSSTLAWKILWMEEPGRLQSMGSLRVRHNWATSLSLFTFIHWRRKWQPTPVFLPGESRGWWSLVGCHLWCHTESEMTEAT